MKTLEKVVTLGEKTFKVGVDRDIAINVFEKYPEVLEYLINKKDYAKSKEETSIFLKMLKNKELGQMFHMEDLIGEVVAYALPLMLKKPSEPTKITAKEILDYAKENGALTTVNSAFLEFLLEAFFQGELEKPKVKFSMK